jgi:HNH endonuclease
MPKGIYARDQRTYDEIRASVQRRLDALSIPISWSGCQAFIGCWDKLGYGTIAITKFRREKAHRAAFEFNVGRFPRELDVLHRCDVRCCINPAHLFLGTAQDNTNDMIAKGRARPVRGEQHGNAKITDDLVRMIRVSSEPSTTLALRIGVSRTTIKDVRKRRIWKHVD